MKVANQHLEIKFNDKFKVDTPFTLEEVENAVHKLKPGRASGCDGLIGEHLIHGGQTVLSWLRNILNAIVEVEAIPPALKSGSIILIYKGNNGKDPLNADSYRGITITSVIAKVLEFLILECIFLESGIPHINQSAYHKRVGCADAIFVTQEAIARYVRDGSTVHMCFYDLQKAFDSVEFPVLLDRLHSVGVNGKLWRIIRNWYQGGAGLFS